MGFLRIVPVVVALATAGCATLQTNGSTQRVPVTSAPSGANVFVDGQVVGVTPVEADAPALDQLVAFWLMSGSGC